MDPISVVFYNNNWDVFAHASHHGWGYTGFGGQYFWDHGCVNSGDSRQAASYCSICDRDHMRWHPGGRDDASWGIYVLSTPHRETWFWTCDGGSNHATSSYWEAKVEIGNRWHQWNWDNAQHRFAGSQWWGNNERRRQCNGWEPANDGWVDFVRIP